MDSIDIEILKALQNDARTSFSSLSKKLGLTPGAIRCRFRKLETAGIIAGFTVNVNVFKLGLLAGHIHIKLSTNSIDDFKKYIKSTIKEREFFHIQTSIEGNVIIYCVVKDFRELTEFLNHIKLFPNIIDIKLRIYEDEPVYLPSNILIEAVSDV